jgi:hypothetical protein
LVSARRASCLDDHHHAGAALLRLKQIHSLVMSAAIRRALSCRLPADVITVTPYTILERVLPARAALYDAGFC